MRAAIAALQAKSIVVSLFIDPDPAQVEMSKQLGAEAIELQTASYSEAKTEAQRVTELHKLRAATALAQQCGLHVHMGHGINYTNVQPIVQIPGVEELNIGHSIVSRAMMVGMERAVREMKDAMAKG